MQNFDNKLHLKSTKQTRCPPSYGLSQLANVPSELASFFGHVMISFWKVVPRNLETIRS